MGSFCALQDWSFCNSLAHPQVQLTDEESCFRNPKPGSEHASWGSLERYEFGMMVE